MPELLNLPASQTSLMCLGVLAVLAVAVVVFTRGRLAYQGRPAGGGGSSGSTEGALTTGYRGFVGLGPSRQNDPNSTTRIVLQEP